MASRLTFGIAATLALTALQPAAANEFEPELRNAFENQLKGWIDDPALIEAIKAQNERHAALSEGDIESLDQEWRAEASSGQGPLINEVLGRPASSFLVERKESLGGLITEVIVMDNRGLNVAQSDVTSDYMQGDEAKWQKTFLAGPDSLFIDDLEFDDSTGSFQCQISATIADPATGEAIGAITFGINVENLS